MNVGKIKEEKRKFLRNIYNIQNSFGVRIGGGNITFSFGILPSKEDEKRLNIWFQQVNGAKEKLYREIYKDFITSPSKYLGDNGQFNYATFFKGRTVINDIRKDRNLITSQPVMEGLNMEITGSIRSFRTNHSRIFEENKDLASKIKDIIQENKTTLNNLSINFSEDDSLINLLNSILKKEYNSFIKTFESLQQLELLIKEIRNKIGEYNYEINQICTKENLSLNEEIKLLPKISLLPRFPQIRDEEIIRQEELIKELKELTEGKIPIDNFKIFFEKRRKKMERTKVRQRKRFEDRLVSYLDRKFTEESEKYKNFILNLEQKIIQSKKHFSQKPYDTQGRNRYFELLALKARLIHKMKEKEINEKLSKLRGVYLAGKEQKEIITLPGFSWENKNKGKPLKNVAIALKREEDKIKLFICISSSAKNFIISDDDRGDFLFLKTTGGQRFRRDSRPKTISFVRGSFLNEERNRMPLLLPLHFGKSYARRVLFQKYWGLFSKEPVIFLNNARLKREKKAPGDPWRYYLDVTLSKKEEPNYKKFSLPILNKAESVIGIDRGEARPITYSILRIKDKEVVKSGFLAEEYTEKLLKYHNIKRDYQSKGATIPKYLKSKISRLQKTLLESAVASVLAFVGEYKGIVVIEDLGKRFFGRERRIIPKKIYKKVEQLLANSLHLAGLLKINLNPQYPKYWGTLLTVNPAGTSQECLKCETKWNSNKIDSIIKECKDNKYKNIRNEILKIKNESFILNKNFKIFSSKSRFSETKTLKDLDQAIKSKDWRLAEKLLKAALGPRTTQDEFICPRCGSIYDSDILAATNIAKRGIDRIQNIIKKT